MTPDAAQHAIITSALDSSAVVIGAPGTGKTFTLIERVVALIETENVAPESVLVLTPTRQAATALRDRIGVRLSVATPGALARSLGSFAFQIVRASMVARGLEPPALLTGADQDRIIADLLDDAAFPGDELLGDDALSGVAWPEALSPALRASQSFRSELRVFLSECTELGVTGAELRESGDESWAAVADFINDYRMVLAGMRSAHRDAADLLSEAAAIVRSDVGGDALSALRVVLVDDAQELTRGGITLIEALRERGVAVLAFGDPDISSGAFRGATPELFAQLAASLEQVFVLDTPHRQSAALTALSSTLTQAIGAGGRVDHRRPPGPADPAESVTTIVASSPFEEIDSIAAVLRQWHLFDNLRWDDMAVIAHDSKQITLLEAALAAREVPTRAAGVPRPLGSEPVVRDILGVLRLALADAATRDAGEIEHFLRSPFGGLDAVGLRRLRARLRQHELNEGGTRSARELLRDAMHHPATLDVIDAPEARTAARFAETLAQTAAGDAAKESAHELLWRVWDRARTLDGKSLATAWQFAAETQGNAEAGRALDALVALFDAAKRFGERNPDERASKFVHDILDSDVPEDTLSTPDRPGVVTLLTPATALGTEFEAVVIAGVQEGVWPNLRLRGGMLQTWRLPATILASRSGEQAAPLSLIDRRRAVMHDELRLFVRAVSRARTQLVITAVDDDDQAPSPFFTFLPDPSDISLVSESEHPLTLRGLVSRHRRTLTTSDSEPDRAEAAQQLAVLAREGVVGADPEQWYGLRALSTTAPLHDLDKESVRVYPSQIETFEECALAWVLSDLGGDTVMPASVGVGTILHDALERVPEGDLTKMRQILEARWEELDFESPWLDRKQRRSAELYLERLHQYLGDVAAEQGRVVASESRFMVAVSVDDEEPKLRAVDRETASEPRQAVMSGSIDRVEVYPTSGGEFVDARGQKWTPMGKGAAGERVVVVDLKTGRSGPETENAVKENAQLAAYQLGVLAGLVPGADPEALEGARLLLVAKTLSKSDYRIAHQHRLDVDGQAAFLARVASAARGMSGSIFTARIDRHCSSAQGRIPLCRIHIVPAVSA